MSERERERDKHTLIERYSDRERRERDSEDKRKSKRYCLRETETLSAC